MPLSMGSDRMNVDIALDEATCVVFESLKNVASSSAYKQYTKRLYNLSRCWSTCCIIIDMDPQGLRYVSSYRVFAFSATSLLITTPLGVQPTTA